MYLGEHRHAQLLLEEDQVVRSSNLVLESYISDDWMYDSNWELQSW
jgi:hypothetical protein